MTTSLQVKFSKDFLLTHGRPEYRDKLLSCGCWTLNREEIRKSSVDYWVFVRQSYLWVTKGKGAGQQCWETRGLKKAQTDALVLEGGRIAPERDFSGFLNDWGAIFGEWE